MVATLLNTAHIVIKNYRKLTLDMSDVILANQYAEIKVIVINAEIDIVDDRRH